MRIGLDLVNTIIGDSKGNVDLCLDYIEKAQSSCADLVVFPEMTLPGYPPRDILFDRTFVQAVFSASLDLVRRAPRGISVLYGSLAEADYYLPNHPQLYNAAFLLQNGKSHLVSTKRILPTHDVFYEPRWFLPGPVFAPITIKKQKIGILIGESSWEKGHPLNPINDQLTAGADLLISMVASPYRKNILDTRLKSIPNVQCPLAYINLIGAADELIFDGRSFLLGSNGQMIGMLAEFSEDLQIFDLDDPNPSQRESSRHFQITSNFEENTINALTLGIRDFAQKNRLDRAFLGLSGGVDSAVTACLAAKALGSENITGISIPSRYTDPRSTQNAQLIAETLGINFEVVDLEAMHQAVEKTIPDLLVGTTAENIQARLRMIILMGYVNRHGGFLLNTANKTELACGYITLYGDMAGSLCPIGDLTKLEVYSLAREINRNRQVIPQYILQRKPSAELKPEQVDPFDYESIAPELERLILKNQSNPVIRNSEHKRWQMGIILKISEKSFGSGRLMPVTRH